MKTDRAPRRTLIALSLAAALFATGCDELSCLISGNNLLGRMTFAEDIAIDPDAHVVAQWSSDSFATVGGQSRVANLHGLITYEYDLCAPTNTSIQVRAFQDRDGDGEIDAGEATGRHDGTANGDAGYLSVSVPANAQSWEKKRGIDITIDTP